MLDLTYLCIEGAAFVAVAEGDMAMNSKHRVVIFFQTVFHQLSVGCAKEFGMTHVSLNSFFLLCTANTGN